MTSVNNIFHLLILIKLSLNKKDLNDVKAALFLVSFSQLPAAEKPENQAAAVTSLRSFIF